VTRSGRAILSRPERHGRWPTWRDGHHGCRRAAGGLSILAYLPLAVGVAAGGIAIAIGKQRQVVLGYVAYRLITVF
jgi:hypothetical protein